VWGIVPGNESGHVAWNASYREEEGVIPHLCKQELKCPTPVRRRLSRTTPFLAGPFQECGRRWRGWTLRSLVVLSNYSAFHRWSAQIVAHLLLSPNELMSCCAAGTNGCLDLRCRVFSDDGRVSAEWSRCPGSMARRIRDSVAPFRRSSGGSILARIGRVSAGVGCRHPVTVSKSR